VHYVIIVNQLYHLIMLKASTITHVQLNILSLSCYVRIANTMLELSVSLATVWTKPVPIGNFFHCHADTRQVELFYSAAAMIASNQTVKVFILPIQ